MPTEQEKAPFKALIRKWEGPDNSDSLRNVAIRTAAMLARVQGVPKDVLQALDGLMTSEFEGLFSCSRTVLKERAADTYVVVRYLNSLAELKRFTASASKRSR